MTLTSFTPIGPNVLIELLPRDTMHGMLYLPDRSVVPNVWGTVRASGEKVVNVKDGMEVLVPATAGTRLTVGGSEYIIAREDEVKAFREATPG